MSVRYFVPKPIPAIEYNGSNADEVLEFIDPSPEAKDFYRVVDGRLQRNNPWMNTLLNEGFEDVSEGTVFHLANYPFITVFTAEEFSRLFQEVQ